MCTGTSTRNITTTNTRKQAEQSSSCRWERQYTRKHCVPMYQARTEYQICLMTVILEDTQLTHNLFEVVQETSDWYHDMSSKTMIPKSCDVFKVWHALPNSCSTISSQLCCWRSLDYRLLHHIVSTWLSQRSQFDSQGEPRRHSYTPLMDTNRAQTESWPEQSHLRPVFIQRYVFVRSSDTVIHQRPLLLALTAVTSKRLDATV